MKGKEDFSALRTGNAARREPEAAAEHTPGPWRVREYLVSNNERAIETAYTHPGSLGTGHKTVAHTHGAAHNADEKLANARLIAAAPDLLTLLRSILKAATAEEVQSLSATALIAMIEGFGDEIRAALAKAGA